MSVNLRNILSISIMLLVIGLLIASDIVPKPVSNDNKLEDRDILAEYDGGTITRKDILDKISKIPPSYQARYQTIDGQVQVLDITATEEAFFLKAKQMGIDKDPAIIEKVEQVEKRYYLQEFYKRNVTDMVIMTDDDLQKFYNENLKQFFLNHNLTIDYIQTANEEEALLAMQEINSGTPFGEVSDKYNQNTYAKGLKGKIKNVRLNGNIPGLGNDLELEAIIAGTEKELNVLKGPIKTALGWHVFRTTEWIAGRQKEFLEVKPEIEQRLRPIKDKELLDILIASLKIKHNVVIDSVLIKSIDLKAKKNNEAIESQFVLSGSHPLLKTTVGQLMDSFNKMSPQEQIFFIKGEGAKQLIDQNLIQNLLWIEGKAQGYDRYFKDNPEYIQAKKSVILRSVYERLVLNSVEISPEDVKARYEQDIESYSVPAHRSIQVLFFKDQKAADKIWRKFSKAHKKGNEKEMTKLLEKNSLKPKESLYPNQYDNGIITGMGPDEDFSKRIWNNPVGYLSPVFTRANGDVVFFRTLDETPKTYKPQTEVEPRIYGLIKQEREKTRQEDVTEQLFVEFNMKKYPERIKLTLTADELFTQADNAARNRNYKDAIVFYDQIVQSYANGVDDYKAFFMKAFLVAEEMQNKDLALQLFNSFLTKFPEGDLHESARFMIDSLQGNLNGFEDFK